MINTISSILPSHEFLNQIEKDSSSLLNKIKSLAYRIFSSIADACYSISRYLGGKSWSIPGIAIRAPYAIYKYLFQKNVSSASFKKELFGTGYHFDCQKELTPSELKSYLPYACATACVHTSNPDWIKPLGFEVVSPKSLSFSYYSVESRDICFFDPQSGLKIVILESEKERIFAFGALDSSRSELPYDPSYNKSLYFRSLGSAIRNWVGAMPRIFARADNVVRTLLKNPMLSDKPITFVGQCYGGALASFIGLRYAKHRSLSIRSICFNTLPLGAGAQQILGEKALSQAEQHITHISAKGDWLSDPTIPKLLDRVVTAIGIRTPGNFGRWFTIPSAYNTAQKAHDYFIGSAMKHLGYDKNTKPSDLSPEFLAAFSS